MDEQTMDLFAQMASTIQGLASRIRELEAMSIPSLEPVITIEQNTTNEGYLKLIGTAAAGSLVNTLVADGEVTTATVVGWVKIEVQDDGNQFSDGNYYIPIYSLA